MISEFVKSIYKISKHLNKDKTLWISDWWDAWPHEIFRSIDGRYWYIMISKNGIRPHQFVIPYKVFIEDEWK